jgi:glycine betaine/proline transport system permease protein
LNWIAIVVEVIAMGHYARNWRLAALVGVLHLSDHFRAVGQRHGDAGLGADRRAHRCGGGLLKGIAAYRWPLFDRMLRPVLDLMHTVPVFAFLVPILFLFGFGPVPALVATIIYAMPPMVRVTTLALRSVPGEIREFGVMTGCSRRQLT